MNDLTDQIIDRIDVAPGFQRRIGGRLDRVEMNAVRPEIPAAKQGDDLRRPAAGIKESVAQAIALFGVHRAIIEIESDITGAALFHIGYFAERSIAGRGFDGKRPDTDRLRSSRTLPVVPGRRQSHTNPPRSWL